MRHKYCPFRRCNTCLEDHKLLADYLYQEIGVSSRRVDILQQYRLYLNDRGYDSETETGWAKPFVFEEKMINRFIEWYKNGEE
jgi:hypothetical protein